MNNPLLSTAALPPFQSILPEHVEPAMDQILADNRAAIAELLLQPSITWDNFITPYEELNDCLSKAWSPVSHLHSVCDSEALRKVYAPCQAKLSVYFTELGQNEALFKAFQSLVDSADFEDLPQERKRYLENCLRDFRLSGVDLSGEKKQRFGEITKRLSELGMQFGNNVLDSTQAWEKLITDPEDLSGLPESALAAAKQAASQKNQSGYLFNLEFPSSFPVMTYCDQREFRQEIYQASNTRASALFTGGDQWDNSALIDELLNLRLEQASLLGFDNYAEYSLATKMASTTDEVFDFLNQLAERSNQAARQEYQTLCQFAAEKFQQDKLEPWDIAYYSEKLRQQQFDLSQEELRPYFPVDSVLSGLFDIVHRLYAIEVKALNNVETWHEDVRVYGIYEGDTCIASFYFDLYARVGKKGGAWMDECRVRRILPGKTLQLPVAYLVCNFNGPVGDQPALLTHNEVTTLFHEFGHGLHHMLTQVECAGVSGINGVPWDAVELPSQFLENWCWHPEAIQLFAEHYETGEPLPDAMLKKMLAAKTFQSGMQMARQLEFSLFDFTLHATWNPPETQVQAVLDKVRERIAVVPVADFNRFQCAFSHIFAGGYAAGYYSYKWAEVLSADAFSRFEEEGIFNAQTGADFKQHILQRGGAEEPSVLFAAFRGRPPEVSALLRHSGLVNK